MATLIATFIVYFFYTTAQARLSESEIETERMKSDQLLLNILPIDIARELKDKGATEPILFHSATVFFTDFVGFTKITETMTPHELVGELDKCFSYFDNVCEHYRLEKLKTIGDSFMAAGGIPIPNNTHAIDCCLAAMEIRDFMDQMQQIKEQQNQPYWQLRIGINTGNLVAGVAGEKKIRIRCVGRHGEHCQPHGIGRCSWRNQHLRSNVSTSA
ncbi:MAG TPA: adenylate/guanylate cyclase domain-containing protein [Turneriella sp.]|nr:adenylate/guanylate cyclase domain-containing protein [Turneriella sp.]